MSATHRLLFAGQPLPGIDLDQLRATLTERLQLSKDQADMIFSGQPVSLKKFTSSHEAENYRARFAELGAKVWVEAIAPALPALDPLPPPVPAPAPAPAVSVAAPAIAPLPAAPAAAGLSLAPAEPPAAEQIDCPNCGERQPKRTLCRKCSADMPRLLAARKEAEAEAREARQYEKANGKAADAWPEEAEVAHEAPPFIGFDLRGRIGRITYLLESLALTAIILPIIVFSLQRQSFILMGVLLLLAVVASLRLTVLRLNDLAWSKWLAAVLLVPYVGILFALVLLVVPGKKGENAEGLPTPIAGLAPLGFCLVIAIGSMLTLYNEVLSLMQNLAGNGQLVQRKGAPPAASRPEPSPYAGKVVVYSISDCRPCADKSDELQRYGIPVEELYLDRDQAALARLQEKFVEAQMSREQIQLPMLEVNGRLMPADTSPTDLVILVQREQ